LEDLIFVVATLGEGTGSGASLQVAFIIIDNNQIIELPTKYIKKLADLNKLFCYAGKCIIDLILKLSTLMLGLKMFLTG